MKSLWGIPLNKISLAAFTTSLLIIFAHFTLHPVKLFGMYTSLFYMDESFTLAALFTSVAAVVVGVLFVAYGAHQKQLKPMLVNIAVGLFFIFFSLDEYFSIHEYIKEKVVEVFDVELVAGYVSFSWILPLLVFIVAAIALLVLLITGEKNRASKKAYVLGLISFMAVLVLEVLGANSYGLLIYIAFVGLEEGLEMIGICFFLLGITQKVLLSVEEE